MSRAYVTVAVGYLLTALAAAGVGFGLAVHGVAAPLVGAGSVAVLAAGTAISNRVAGLRKAVGAR